MSQLGGACADVTTVIKSSSVDPHDYEPTAADIAAFSGAKLVVVNGADYDHWAEQAVASTGGSPTVVSAAAVNNVADGANPHLWYSPDYVFATAAAVTDALKTVDPSAASYFDQQASAWDASMAPYRDTIARIVVAAIDDAPDERFLIVLAQMQMVEVIGEGAIGEVALPEIADLRI